MSQVVSALRLKARENPDHWVGGVELGPFRIDARWAAPRFLLAFKAARLDRTEYREEREVVAEVRKILSDWGIGKSGGWEFRTEHSPFFYRFYAERDEQEVTELDKQSAA